MASRIEPVSAQARKLGLKRGHRVFLDGHPLGWELTDAPAELTFVGAGQSADVVISFFAIAADLPDRLPGLARQIFPAGSLWICWPRRAGGHRSDIRENTVRGDALPLGVVDTKVAALDDDWSALRLVWRLANRHAPPAAPSVRGG